MLGLDFRNPPDFRTVSCAIRCFRNEIRKYFLSTFGNESPIRKSNPETKLKYFCIGGNESRYESPKQTNSRANGSTGLPEDIEAPSAASKTPACKTCFVTAACIVASVKAPAVSYVAASANIHTAPLRRNANNAGTNSRLPAIHCNI